MTATDSTPNGAAPPRRESHSAPQRAPERDAEIEGLALVLRRLRRGAAALKAENDQLRAEIAELQVAASARVAGEAPVRTLGKLAEITLPRNPSAPGAARIVIAHCLTGLVSQRILHEAERLVSELVAQSVQHSEIGEGGTVLVRVYLAAERLRLEIEPSDTAAVAVSSPQDHRSSRGRFGRELVELLGASWDAGRNGSAAVWFEMARA